MGGYLIREVYSHCENADVLWSRERHIVLELNLLNENDLELGSRGVDG